MSAIRHAVAVALGFVGIMLALPALAFCYCALALADAIEGKP